MKQKTKTQLILGGTLLVLFVFYTLSLKFVDLGAIGPRGSEVAYSTVNEWVHDFFGVNMTLYDITDWAGIVTILIALGFGVLGLAQLIRRKSLLKVDHSILVLGVFYIVVFATFAFFEVVVINRRPVLIEGVLEASYPSSTTMIAMCVLPTAMMQLHRLIGNKVIRNVAVLLLGLFTAFMVVGRLFSGVHWATDILGGAIFSTAMILLYCGVNSWLSVKCKAKEGAEK